MTGEPAGWHIAQMNVARALYPLDDPGMSGFMDRLDENQRARREQPWICLAPAVR